MIAPRPWLDQEIEYLRANPHARLTVLAEHLGRSKSGVATKRREMGLRAMEPEWTQAEDDFLRANVSMPVADLMAHFGRSRASIYSRRMKLGLRCRVAHKRPKWTEEDIAFIRANLHLSVEETAAALGRSVSSVHSKKHKIAAFANHQCCICATRLGARGKYCAEHLWIGRYWTNYQKKCAARGMEMRLTHDAFAALVQQPCHYCGGEGGGVDRIDSSKTYEAGNVVPACTQCNIMKGSLPVGDWLNHIRRIAAHSGGFHAEEVRLDQRPDVAQGRAA